VFGDATIKDLNSNIIENKEQLENCRTYINQLNVRSLKSNELYQLANLLYSCNQKSKLAEKNLKEVVTKISTLSEDSYSFVWDKLS
jgi:DNA-directed RNA polymerase sigma subunit (sigma70/sigma32)